ALAEAAAVAGATAGLPVAVAEAAVSTVVTGRAEAEGACRKLLAVNSPPPTSTPSASAPSAIRRDVTRVGREGGVDAVPASVRAGAAVVELAGAALREAAVLATS